MRVSIGSDHRGVQAKAQLLKLIEQWGHEVSDEGTHDCESADYPNFARLVSSKVSEGKADRGVLICGTGIGMAITANKFAGVRAATCYDEFTAEMCRRHNDVNVLCLSGDPARGEKNEQIVRVWLDTSFEGGRHARRLQQIAEIEQQRCSR